ncbi:MAG: hypothetical protein WKF58_00830 [Ilumatobacteraceae bacterium]
MLTFSQVHVGLPVFHAMLKVRIAACVVTSVSGTLVPGIALEPTPTIGRKEALRIAAAGTPGGAVGAHPKSRFLLTESRGRWGVPGRRLALR